MTDPFEQLKQAYLAGFPAKFAAIKKALQSHDLEALFYVIHQLAGTAGSYGFDELSRLASDAESSIKNKQLPNCDLILEFLDQAGTGE